jgi:hypothetical protein
VCTNNQIVEDSGSTTTDTVVHFMLLRVGADGSSSKIDVKKWDPRFMEQYSFGHCSYVNAGVVADQTFVSAITNADQGTEVWFEAHTPEYCGSGTTNPTVCNQDVPAGSTFGLASTGGRQSGVGGEQSDGHLSGAASQGRYVLRRQQQQ